MKPKKQPPKSFNEAAIRAVHKAATNPLAPPRVREAMKRVEKDFKNKK
jgi:hypothetical protein